MRCSIFGSFYCCLCYVYRCHCAAPILREERCTDKDSERSVCWSLQTPGVALTTRGGHYIPSHIHTHHTHIIHTLYTHTHAHIHTHCSPCVTHTHTHNLQSLWLALEEAMESGIQFPDVLFLYNALDHPV